MTNTVHHLKLPAAMPTVSNLPPDDRAARGKALRDTIPRENHARWKPDKDRTNPVQILRASDKERLPELIPIRYGRMLQSPFAFFRGSASVMAADLSQTPSTGLHVQACGDCHLLNFGGFATPERNIIFDINDFDETLPAPWEWDIKRLCTSIVLAARSLGISDDKGRDLASGCARSYRMRLREFSQMDPLASWYASITADDLIESLPRWMRKGVRKRVEKAKSAAGSELDFPKLAGTVSGQIRIREQPPLIYHPLEAASPEFQETLTTIFSSYRETLTDDRRILLDRFDFVDAAIKVVGVGSVGRRCWIVLMMSEANDPLFLQVKEAAQSALEPYAGPSLYQHHGQRVVMGQRLLQPASDIFLGWVTAPNGRQFYVRQLRDAKIKPLVETFDANMLDAYARACGWALARAHAKASEVITISGYLGTSSDAFDVAMGDFALAYADQAERDHATLKTAVRKGDIDVYRETE